MNEFALIRRLGLVVDTRIVETITVWVKICKFIAHSEVNKSICKRHTNKYRVFQNNTATPLTNLRINVAAITRENISLVFVTVCKFVAKPKYRFDYER